MKIKLFVIFIFGLFNSIWPQKTEIIFDVHYKSRKIGTIQAIEHKSGNQRVKGIKTITTTEIIKVKLRVESEISVIYKDSILVKGVAYRHSNKGNENVHSTVIKTNNNAYHIERNGEKEKLEDIKINFCDVDLYFIEPKGIEKIFSTMYAKMLPLKLVSPGKYWLETPDNKDSYYTYINGKLIFVEANTALGKVISKRV
jgi:hypothetical protein